MKTVTPERMNNKIYISLPIAHHEKDVVRRYLDAIAEIRENPDTSEFTIAGPYNIDDFEDGVGLTVSRNKSWAECMGVDAAELLTCDSIFMTHGWINSIGCRVEHAIAKEMNMKIFYSKSQTL